MRKPFTVTTSLLFLLLIAGSAVAQVRGRGRLQGIITDKNTGKPIAGATITVAIASGNTEPIIAKSDSHGHWSALGMVSGVWNIDINATGYSTSRGTANVSEVQQLPMIKTELAPEEKAEAAAVTATPLIPKEGEDAINEGQTLMGQQKYKEALVDFEKALPMVPTDKPETKTVHLQLEQVMAQAYYRAGDVPHAISMLEAVTTEDPTNTTSGVLLVNLYVEAGRMDAAKAELDKLPPTAITDSTVYINLGIVLMNKKNPAEAATYFTKAIALNAKAPDGYYYRGLAEAQMKKTAEARADFQQAITIAPDSQEAKDSKAMLDALPKK